MKLEPDPKPDLAQPALLAPAVPHWLLPRIYVIFCL